MEITSIYAILYLLSGAIGYSNNKIIQKPFEALYFSIITISTTGFGDITPKNGCGQFLASTEIIIGIFMLIVFLGTLISLWKGKDDRFYEHFKKFVVDRKK